jgi:hypothetical protein
MSSLACDVITRLLITIIAVACPAFAQTNTPSVTNAVLHVPLSDIGQKTVILGALGRPIGEDITIHGRKEPRRPMSGPNEFRVDTVNGAKLKEPTIINVRGTSGPAIPKPRFADMRLAIFGLNI